MAKQSSGVVEEMAGFNDPIYAIVDVDGHGYICILGFILSLMLLLLLWLLLLLLTANTYMDCAYVNLTHMSLAAIVSPENLPSLPFEYVLPHLLFAIHSSIHRIQFDSPNGVFVPILHPYDKVK